MAQDKQRGRAQQAPQQDPDRHTDVLSEVLYQRVGAEMRYVAQCMGTYFGELLDGGFDRDEAFSLVEAWHVAYWEKQHDMTMLEDMLVEWDDD